MTYNETLYGTANDYLGSPLKVAELEKLNLSSKCLERLQALLEAANARSLTFQEQAQLNAYKEAVFYLRMGSAA